MIIKANIFEKAPHCASGFMSLNSSDLLGVKEQASRNSESCFVMGTNAVDTPASEILEIYRKDQQGVERSFRFLKNPMYFADAFYLKNRKRIVALVTIMTMALLVHFLLQRKLRMALAEQKETVFDQKKKPTSKPTMNWVNQCFEGVDIIRENNGGKMRYIFVRIDDFVKKVLAVLGPNYARRYSDILLC